MEDIIDRMKINEIFLSIQGEGVQTGLPTFFIRTKGCNLRCNYCDTKYAYTKGHDMTLNEIVKEVRKQPYKLVCLTGGEPLIQPIAGSLIEKLVQENYKVCIETNGSINISKFPNNQNVLYSLDIKCPSSSMTDKMYFKNLNYLKKKDQIKFVMRTQKDYEFAKSIVKRYKLSNQTNVLFQPVGGIKARWIVDKVLSDKLNVRIGLQIHKIIWPSSKRGV